MDCSKENDVIKLSVVHLPSQPDLSAIACTSIISLLLKSKPATTKNQHCNDVFFLGPKTNFSNEIPSH